MGLHEARKNARTSDDARSIALAQDRIEQLEKALREMVYETTHLSPCEDDGSHKCKISGATLAKARAALSG